jgi:hypothetical protein
MTVARFIIYGKEGVVAPKALLGKIYEYAGTEFTQEQELRSELAEKYKISLKKVAGICRAQGIAMIPYDGQKYISDHLFKEGIERDAKEAIQAHIGRVNAGRLRTGSSKSLLSPDGQALLDGYVTVNTPGTRRQVVMQGGITQLSSGNQQTAQVAAQLVASVQPVAPAQQLQPVVAQLPAQPVVTQPQVVPAAVAPTIGQPVADQSQAGVVGLGDVGGFPFAALVEQGQLVKQDEERADSSSVMLVYDTAELTKPVKGRRRSGTPKTSKKEPSVPSL